MSSSSQNNSNFTALDPALGYLYQLRLGLSLSLNRLYDDNEIFSVYFELLDDIHFETSGKSKDILQTKHHRKHSANLTDASPDLWKTLRVWIEGHQNQSISKDSRLYLITTSSVGSGATSLLLSKNRNEVAAKKKLFKVATDSKSKSKTIKTAYQLFKDLSESQRLQLLESIFIIPNMASISELEEALLRKARTITKREHAEALLERLEGWWYRKIIMQWMDSISSPNTTMKSIDSDEIEMKINSLREEFTRDNLPIDDNIFSFDVDPDKYENEIFVEQLKWIKLSQKRIFFAIQDYYRAYTQRSRWTANGLLAPFELERYERRLKESLLASTTG